MDLRYQARFDSSGQGQANGLNTTPAALSTSASPFYPPGHIVHTGGVHITMNSPDVQVVANALQTVLIPNNSGPPADAPQKSPRPPKNFQKLASKPQTNSPSMGSLSSQEKRDAKVQPSQASGGIPDPTNAYLGASNFIPQPLEEPQHLLVVIDLNGTLLFRPSRRQPTKFTARPNTRQFLRYCIETFTVVIWSSAKPENVKNMCDAILAPELRKQVVAIWGRDKFGLTKEDYETRVQCYKQLTKLWSDNKVARSHPLWAAGGRWDQTNTVLIDDSIEKGRSEPFNLVEIPEFFGDEKELGEFLPQVHDYLNHLSMHSNVSACLRARPFRAQLAPH
ncbi:HAD-like protein [Stipitochalara longipes BDJ]|nr:HAD-like protein [Stipitochalara longipes BDJ]